jgi:acyl carrier protein
MAANRDQIIDKLSEYLKKRFLAKDVELHSELAFSDYGIDSMTVVELVMFIEEEFAITIPADQLTGDNLRSLDSLAECAIKCQS